MRPVLGRWLQGDLDLVLGPAAERAAAADLGHLDVERALHRAISVSFQSRILPEYLTFTDCAGRVPSATVPKAMPPGLKLTSVRLVAETRRTAVEMYFGPKA